MNKKVIGTLTIIFIAILLIIFSDKDTKKNENPLPTRDTVDLGSYESIEDFCQEYTTSQELEDITREESFYQDCLLQNAQ